MTIIFKLIQTKKDGWNIKKELSSLNITAVRYEEAWDNILLNLFNDRDSYKALCDGKKEDVKKAIEKNMLEHIKRYKEELYEDLNNFIKIYPLIKKKEV